MAILVAIQPPAVLSNQPPFPLTLSTPTSSNPSDPTNSTNLGIPESMVSNKVYDPPLGESEIATMDIIKNLQHIVIDMFLIWMANWRNREPWFQHHATSKEIAK
ncbi:hypothetical protein HAX54_012285 [Datura stramonium]|uniref:Uncharacterized protein n=1 Tax=Datura stramonium TaxID=4076 RepID=A0ABS8TJK9_DATST|nr:hypothetical protein [Datura stramonium]